jgi:hypothetical protein
MNIYNNLKKQDKYLILVRKLKEAFISFNDDLLEVFPNNNNLFIQRIISYQLPDTSLFKILQNNININLINTNDECYLKFDLCFLKNYENYLNENNSSKEYFKFQQLLTDNYNINILEDNMEMIWKWLKIITILIINIEKNI